MKYCHTDYVRLDEVRPWGPAEKLFRRYTDDEAAQLADLQDGAERLPPLRVDAEFRLIDGYNRLAAATKRGDQEIRVDVYAYEDERDMEQDALALNTMRRHLSPVESGRAAQRLAELRRPDPEETRKARAEGGKEGGRGKQKPCDTTESQGNRGILRQAAKDVGTSVNTARRVGKVDATEDPVLIEAMEKREIPIQKAAKIADLPEPERPEAIERAKVGEPVEPPPMSGNKQLIGLSERTSNEISRVHATRDKALIAAMAERQLSIRTAAKIAALPEDERPQAIEDVKSGGSIKGPPEPTPEQQAKLTALQAMGDQIAHGIERAAEESAERRKVSLWVAACMQALIVLRRVEGRLGYAAYRQEQRKAISEKLEHVSAEVAGMATKMN